MRPWKTPPGPRSPRPWSGAPRKVRGGDTLAGSRVPQRATHAARFARGARAAGLVLLALLLPGVLVRFMARPPEPPGTAPSPDDSLLDVPPPPGASSPPPLPGLLAVSDAVETPVGWVLLDAPARGIRLLPFPGIPEWRTGGPGDGPGELRRPAALAVVGGQVLVGDLTGRRVDRFDLRGRFRGRLRLPPGACPGALLEAMDALDPERLVLLSRCPATPGRPAHGLVEIVDPGRGTRREIRTVPAARSGSLFDPLLRPLMAARGRSVLTGNGRDRCLVRLTLPGGSTEEVCIPETVAPPPLPRELRDSLLRWRRRLPPALRGWEVPEHLPLYDRIFLTDRGPAVRVLEGLRRRVLLPLDGATDAPLPLPATTWTFPGDRSVLRAWESPTGVHAEILPPPPGGLP